MKDDEIPEDVSVVANAIGYTFQVLRERSAEMGAPVVELADVEREWVIAAAIKAIAHLDSWRSQETLARAQAHGLA
jgi:hypothetical protein